jgi:predicted dehydrogenase
MAIVGSSSSWSVPGEFGEVRLGILGAGKMAREHARVFASIEGVSLCAVCGRSEPGTRSFAQQFSIPGVFLDPARMIEQAALDAIVVAVSHESMVAVSGIALHSGRACLLEKPAGFSSRETAALAAIAEGAKTLNMVGVNRRFYSVIQAGLLAVLGHGDVRGLLLEAHEPISARRSAGSRPGWVYDQWLIANTIHAIICSGCSVARW